MFFLYLDIQPIFVKDPQIPDNYTITGCQYSSIINLTAHAYLLFNDSIRIDFTTILKAPRSRRAITASLYNLPQYRLRSSLQQNSVQCVIDDPRRMKAPVKSNKLFFNIPGKILKIFFLFYFIRLIFVWSSNSLYLWPILEYEYDHDCNYGDDTGSHCARFSVVVFSLCCFFLYKKIGIENILVIGHVYMCFRMPT